MQAVSEGITLWQERNVYIIVVIIITDRQQINWCSSRDDFETELN